MKLLILTQRVNSDDAELGFFHRWLLEFAKNCDHVIVVCLEKGNYNLPENVEVFSLGKEEGVSRIKYVRRFLYYIWVHRKEYDTVFVHMNPIYVVLGGVFWRLWNKKIALWYTHRQVDLLLRIAEKLVHIIFSASGYSFQLKTNKLHIVGHGIDVDKYVCEGGKEDDVLRIVSVGRITRIKNCEVLIRATALLRDKIKKPLNVVFVGGPTNKDDLVYFEELKKIVEELRLKDTVVFLGRVTGSELQKSYCNATLTVNMCPTGGVDKTVLESMAVRTPVLASNEAFINIFGDHAKDLVFKFQDHQDLANKIVTFTARNDIKVVVDNLERKVREEFSVESLIKNLVEKMQHVRDKRV